MPGLDLRFGSARKRRCANRTQGWHRKAGSAGAQNRPAAENHAIAPTHDVPTKDAITADYVGFSIHRQRVWPIAHQATVTNPWPNAAMQTQTAGQYARPF